MTDVGQQTTISPSIWQLPLVATLRLGNTERFRKTVCQQLKQLKFGARPSCSPQKVTLRCACIPDLALRARPHWAKTGVFALPIMAVVARRVCGVRERSDAGALPVKQTSSKGARQPALMDASYRP
jgi:hypothetical protein